MLRPLHLVLIALLLVLQGQLWFGRGSIPDVMRLRQTLNDQKQQNAAAQLANDRLSAELSPTAHREAETAKAHRG